MRSSGYCLVFVLAASVGCGDNLTHVERVAAETGLPCAPNLDGTLTDAELPVLLGREARFRVATGVAVYLDGSVAADGRRTFSLRGNHAGEKVVGFTATPLAARWHASSFPGGMFVAPLDAAGAIEGVYSRSDDGVRLHGVASRTETPEEGKTLLAYDPPALVLPLPLRVGSAWLATARVEGGTLHGRPYAGTDRYEGHVATFGELRLPELTFAHVLQVRLKTTLSPSSGAPTVRHQAGFYAECFGEVARATAADGDDRVAFTEASELRRFVP